MTPVIYAHRGASAVRPENTLEAFRVARELGADGVELDVRRSADGVLVVHHDPLLPDGRTVSALLRSELPSSVPDLGQALDACAGMVVNVEVKNIPGQVDFDDRCGVADEVVTLLVDRGRRDDVLVSGFHLATIDRIRELEPDIPTAFLTFIDPSAAAGVRLAADRGHLALNPHTATVDAALVAAASERGLQVNAWTVDDPARAVELSELGVDGIVTNVPDVIREALTAG